MHLLADLQVSADLGDELAVGLEAVEVRLHDAAAAFPGRSAMDVTPLLGTGKRIRPLLTLLGSRFGDPEPHRVIPAATMVELAHVATLVQDDVIDAAAKRRGEATVNATQGNRRAVLVSDWFLATAAQLGAELQDPTVIQRQAHTLHRLVRGQTNELVGPENGADERDHYLDVIADKTASLLEFAVWLGARVSGADRTSTKALAHYGYALGIAFQIRDDIHDIAPPLEGTGKPLGNDLRQGVRTLPILYAEARDDRLRDLLADGPLDDDARLREAVQRVAEGGLIRARLDLAAYGDAAKLYLEQALDIPARKALEALADFVALS